MRSLRNTKLRVPSAKRKMIARAPSLLGLLAFIDTPVESPEMDNVVAALSRLENHEELIEVTGEVEIVTLLSVSDIEEFS